MGLIVKPYTFAAGATIIAAEHNDNFDTAYTLLNGNIENANIKATAAIVDTKLAQIVTASKVHGSSITALGSISTAAGILTAAQSVSGAALVTASVPGSALTTFSTIPSSAGYIPDDNLRIVAGIWTGTFTASKTGAITMVSVLSSGYYQKNGKQVSVSGAFKIAQVSSGCAGELVLDGLPFATGSSNFHYGTLNIYADNVSASNTQITSYALPASTNVYIRNIVGGIATGFAASVKSSTLFIVGGTYFTN